MTTSLSRRLFLSQLSGATCAGLASVLAGQDPQPPVPDIADRLRRQIEQAPLEMRLTDFTSEGCHAFQDKFRAKLTQLLGPFQPPDDWKTTIISSRQLSGYRRHELLLEADGHPPLPIYLLVPDTAENSMRPGIVALHGHGEFGHHVIAGRDDLPGIEKAIALANYDYGRRLAERGYIVACPCLTPFGDRLGRRQIFGQRDPCEDVFLRMLSLGRLLIAENLRDALWALNLLIKQSQVDIKKLACVGLSYGGRLAMLTAAMEPRIHVAVISGALNVMQERLSQPYSCGAQIIPGLLQYGDVPEIGSLIAPRHAVWEMGARDALIKPEWASQAVGRMRKVFEALGVSDRLIVDRFEGGHQWHGIVAYDVLTKVFG